MFTTAFSKVSGASSAPKGGGGEALPRILQETG